MFRRSDSARAPLLCYVTDRHSLPGIEASEERDVVLGRIQTAATAGVDWVQIREKDLSGRDCSLLVREALQRRRESSTSNIAPTRILTNDRLDIALAEGAGGAHFGENSLPAPEAKRLAEAYGRRGDFFVGVSCHSLEAAISAARGGADYLFFGPVFATPSKASYGAAQGLEKLGEVCRAVSVPVLAIGGISLENAASCLAAGASGIAAIRLFQDAGDIAPVVERLRQSANPLEKSG